jgi:hypothetical protein
MNYLKAFGNTLASAAVKTAEVGEAGVEATKKVVVVAGQTFDLAGNVVDASGKIVTSSGDVAKKTLDQVGDIATKTGETAQAFLEATQNAGKVTADLTTKFGHVAGTTVSRLNDTTQTAFDVGNQAFKDVGQLGKDVGDLGREITSAMTAIIKSPFTAILGSINSIKAAREAPAEKARLLKNLIFNKFKSTCNDIKSKWVKHLDSFITVVKTSLKIYKETSCKSYIVRYSCGENENKVIKAIEHDIKFMKLKIDRFNQKIDIEFGKQEAEFDIIQISETTLDEKQIQYQILQKMIIEEATKIYIETLTAFTEQTDRITKFIDPKSQIHDQSATDAPFSQSATDAPFSQPATDAPFSQPATAPSETIKTNGGKRRKRTNKKSRRKRRRSQKRK